MHHPQRLGEESAPAHGARSDPRFSYEPPTDWAMLDPRERHRFSLRTPGPAVPTRAYQPRHNASTTAACAPPTETSRPANAGLKAVQLDKPHSISAVLPTDVVNAADRG